jgi:hypothetical protein
MSYSPARTMALTLFSMTCIAPSAMAVTRQGNPEALTAGRFYEVSWANMQTDKSGVELIYILSNGKSYSSVVSYSTGDTYGTSSWLPELDGEIDDNEPATYKLTPSIAETPIEILSKATKSSTKQVYGTSAAILPNGHYLLCGFYPGDQQAIGFLREFEDKPLENQSHTIHFALVKAGNTEKAYSYQLPLPTNTPLLGTQAKSIYVSGDTVTVIGTHGTSDKLIRSFRKEFKLDDIENLANKLGDNEVLGLPEDQYAMSSFLSDNTQIAAVEARAIDGVDGMTIVGRCQWSETPNPTPPVTALVISNDKDNNVFRETAWAVSDQIGGPEFRGVDNRAIVGAWKDITMPTPSNETILISPKNTCAFFGEKDPMTNPRAPALGFSLRTYDDPNNSNKKTAIIVGEFEPSESSDPHPRAMITKQLVPST